MKPYQATVYPPIEEKFNIISHGFGFVLSIVATTMLLLKINVFQNSTYTLSCAIYGFSLMILYAASTLYHSAKKPKLRNRLNIFDHASIYVLIAGTYTPICLITLEGKTGMALLISIWAFGLIGVVLKLFFTGRYDKLSTWMYVFMGWMALFAIKPLLANLATSGLWWLLGGGIAYCIGAILYSLPHRVKYNHAKFHVFVLAGSFGHFMSIYCWVLP
ncbi:MAG: hemolysin D [Bacteroidetes bacterium]|nr:MAG: hemolysin D [Bacteroidota bacterium]